MGADGHGWCGFTLVWMIEKISTVKCVRMCPLASMNNETTERQNSD